MTQLQFHDIPAARTTDPATSREAITLHRGRESNCQAVWWCVRDYPGLTYREIAGAVNMDAVEVMRRLNDLHRKGLVSKGEARACSTNGHRMSTWRAA